MDEVSLSFVWVRRSDSFQLVDSDLRSVALEDALVIADEPLLKR